MTLRTWLELNLFFLVPALSLIFVAFDTQSVIKSLLNVAGFVWLPYWLFAIGIYKLFRHRSPRFLLWLPLALPLLFGLLYGLLFFSVLFGPAGIGMVLMMDFSGMSGGLFTLGLWALAVASSVVLVFYIATGIGWKTGWLNDDGDHGPSLSA